jgi:hypothetical protein
MTQVGFMEQANRLK